MKHFDERTMIVDARCPVHYVVLNPVSTRPEFLATSCHCISRRCAQKILYPATHHPLNPCEWVAHLNFLMHGDGWTTEAVLNAGFFSHLKSEKCVFTA
jgi:hypothetical protein